MPKSTAVRSLIQQNPLRVYVHFHVFSLLIHIAQLFKQMVIEYSSPYKDLAYYVMMLDCFGDQILFIFPTVEIITAIVTYP